MNNIKDIQSFLFDGGVRLICGYPGIGKSFLAELDDRFIDVDSFEYALISNNDGTYKMNPEFPVNYIKAVFDIAKDSDKIFLISSHLSVLNALSTWDKNYYCKPFKFIIVYPSVACHREYLQRYRIRESPKLWIAQQGIMFRKRIVGLNAFKHNLKYVLNPGETLESMIHKVDSYID